jgi:hypothetical protein
MDPISGTGDAAEVYAYGWWSVAVTVTGGSSPLAGDKMTGATSTKVAYLTVTPSAWTGAVTCYFYGMSGAFQSENVTFGTEGGGPGTGTGTVPGAMTYCAWQTITSGALAARIAPGDTIRIRGNIGNRYPGDTAIIDPAVVQLGGTGTWTNDSATVTLSANTDTLNVEMCDATGTGNNQWSTTPIANVTAATSTTICKEGSTPTSIATTIAAGFTTGRCSWANFASLNLAAYQGISFWIRSSVAVTVSYLRVDLCTDTGTHGSPGTPPATAVDTFTIPFKLEIDRWYPVTLMKDGGGNLNGAITSIALNVLTDYGAGIVYLDNIIAVKTTGLSLQSLIGRNVAGETWWTLKSINGVTVILGESQQGGTSVTKYYLQTADGAGPLSGQATYRRETIKTTLATATTTAVQTFQETGTIGLEYTYSGGWSNNTNTLTDMTWFDGLMGWGYGIYAVTMRSFIVQNICCTRYINGYFLSTIANSTLSDIHAAGNATGGIHCSYCSNIILNIPYSVQNITRGIAASASQKLIVYSPTLLTNISGILCEGSMIAVYGGRSSGGTQDILINVGGIVRLMNFSPSSTAVLGASTSYYSSQGYVKSQMENGTTNNHKTRVGYGRDLNAFFTISYDATLYRTSSPSTRLAPNNATYKAESATPDDGMKVPVASGSTVTVHVWVRKSSGYNGAQPRLIVRRGDWVGYTVDEVLDTATYELMTLDVAPGTNWSVGDTITGVTSTKTCVIVEMHTTLIYTVKDRNGTFTLGEVLTNGTFTADQGATKPTFGVKGYDDTTVTKDWEELTGTTAAASADGVFEFILDGDGTAGFFCIDDWHTA